MIHIFFTKSVRNKEDQFKLYLEQVIPKLKQDDIFDFHFSNDIVQIFFDDTKSWNLRFNENLEEKDDSIILINDNLTVSNKEESSLFVIENSLEDDVKVGKDKLMSILKKCDECVVYFHTNGLSQHINFKKWLFEAEEAYGVKLIFKTNSNQGADIKSFSHEDNGYGISPFYELMKLLSQEDLNKQSFKIGLHEIKNACFGSDEEQTKTSDRQIQICLLNKVIGGVTDFNSVEKDLCSGIDWPESLGSLLSRNKVLTQLKKKFEI